MKLEISDTFEVSRDTFVNRIFFSEDYMTALHDHLGFRSREVLERRDSDETLFLLIDFESGEKLPWAARKLWGDHVGWTEELTYHKSSYRIESRMVPRALAKRVSTVTTMRFEEPRPGQCRRTVAVEVAVKVPVVGKKIASKMAEDIRRSFRRTAAFTDDYIRREGLT